jgi:serine/threonine protein kinase
MEQKEDKIQCQLCKKFNNELAKSCHYCGTSLLSFHDSHRSKPETIIVEALSRDYEIIEIIGKGGMATVYKALHKRLDRIVALKVIHQNLIHDEDLVSRFINEARICAGLNHRNIITVHDIGIIGTVYFIAMEYLEGNDLYSIIRQKGALSVEYAMRFAIPVADALNYMHRLGFIHRDVKSSNIFITNDGRPVLMDFGIVHSNNGKTISTSAEILGTPEYMSPEQASGNSEMDPRSDIYSFGVMLYEALTGHLPFRGDNFLTTLHKVINESPKPPIEINKKIPRWLNELILTCLNKNIEQRIPSGEILLKRLIVQGKPIKGGKSKSEKITLVSIILVFVLLVSTAVYIFGFQQQEINRISIVATSVIPETSEVFINPEPEGNLVMADSLAASDLAISKEINQNPGTLHQNQNSTVPALQPTPKPAPPALEEKTSTLPTINRNHQLYQKLLMNNEALIQLSRIHLRRLSSLNLTFRPDSG